MLVSRSAEERQLYMDLQPCGGCGAEGFEWTDHYSADLDGQLISAFSGACPRCDTTREFEFVVSGDEPPPPAFGGPEPSQIIDPGQFLALARNLAQLVPGDPANCPPDAVVDATDAISAAVAAMDEVLKFVPDGADAVPSETLTSDRGKAVYAADPGQFRRMRLEAVTGGYRKVLLAYRG
ncbi:MAG: hypothetical protein KJO75_08895 [Dactylosporangium sp.]|nr:hypothetical protein [Dactylosporangium sp.]